MEKERDGVEIGSSFYPLKASSLAVGLSSPACVGVVY